MASHSSILVRKAYQQISDGQPLEASLTFIRAWRELGSSRGSPSSSSSSPPQGDGGQSSSSKWEARNEIYKGFKSLFDVHGDGRLSLTLSSSNRSSSSSTPPDGNRSAEADGSNNNNCSRVADPGSGVSCGEQEHILAFYRSLCSEGDSVALLCRGWFYGYCCDCLHQDELARRYGTSSASRDDDDNDVGDSVQEQESGGQGETREKRYVRLALADFQRVVDLEGSGSPLLLAFGHYSLARMLISYVEDEDRLERAIDHCTRALELDPDFMLALFNRASTWFMMDRCDDALQDYTAIIERTNDPDAYCSRAQLLKDRLFQYERAMQDVSTCLELDPQNSTAYATRASLHEARWQDHDMAFKDYNRAIDCNPNNAMALFGRGNIFMYRNEPERALADYDAALALEPLSQAFNNRGVLYEQHLHNIGQAYADYCAAVQCDSKNAEAYLNRAGLLQVYFQQAEEALKDYDMAIKLDSANPQAFNNRGSLHEEHFKNLAAARDDFERALALDKNNTKARANLERVMRKLESS